MNNREIWLFVFLAGVLLFNWPFLEIFSQSASYYLFGIWGLYILAIKLFMAAMQRRGE
jgi:hypothetical protein